MKKISKEQLRKIAKSGWVVDDISNPDTSKEDGLKALSDVFDSFVADNKKTMSSISDTMNEFVAHQQARDVENLSLVKESLKQPQAEPTKTTPKKWRFKVGRDRWGLIENVIATEI